jgi:hypothetical protein
MTNGSEILSNGSVTAQDRFSGGVSAYRQTRREAALAAENADGAPLPTRSPGMSGSPSAGLELTGTPDRAGRLSSLDLQGLTEPAFSPTGWSDPGTPSMADHPLLRGLLHELPARGTMPASDWLDRWFEAARSILELLYVQEARRK